MTSRAEKKRSRFLHYYVLAKPGIVYGNSLMVVSGFLFASRWHYLPQLFLAVVFGIALVIASACVFNNYFDRDIDRAMERTKGRALATGLIGVKPALLYGALLGMLGFGALLLLVNLLTAGVALVGFLVYVFAYTFSKRIGHWAVIVGSVSGAVPLLAGYTAAADRLDLPALILFLILALWQMPHFYAISMYRMPEYVSANIPVLPAKKGMRAAKIHIVLYIAAFVVATSALAFYGFAGYTYLTVMLLVSGFWFGRAVQGFYATDDAKWARGIFFVSLIVLLTFSVALSTGSILP